MTRPWWTVGVIVSTILTQWSISRAMVSGSDVSLAITAVVVAVIFGSLLVGLAFGERATPLQVFGLLIAIVGVVITNLAQATHT